MTIEQIEPLGAKVRLRYSLVINFISRIIALLLNLAFIIIVARKLSTADFSAWIILNKYLGYSILFVAIYGFWTIRAISRGWNVSKNSLRIAIFLGFTVSCISLPVLYYLWSFMFVDLFPVLIFAFVIFEEYIARAFLVIAGGYKPQFGGYYTLIVSLLRIIFAYYMVVILEFGLLGAVLAVILSRALGIIVSYYYNRELIKTSKFDPNITRMWIRNSWYTLAFSFVSVLIMLDAIIVRIITKSDLVIAYYGVVFLVTNFVGTIRVTSRVVSARVLAKRKQEVINEAIWLVLFLTMPLVVVMITFSKAIIAIMNIRYIAIAHVVAIFAISGLMRLIYEINKATLNAWEYEDYNIYERFSIMNTALFDTLIIELITSVAFLISLGIISFFVSNPVTLVYIWGVLYLIKFLVGIIAIEISGTKRFGVQFTSNRKMLIIQAKYALASLVTILVGLNIHIHISTRFFDMVYELMGACILVMIIFYVVLLIIDQKARTFVVTFVKRYIKKF